MQVVDVVDVVVLHQVPADLGQIHTGRCGFEQDAAGLAEQAVGRVQHQAHDDSEAMESARSKPVARMTRPAMTVPMKP